MIAFNAKFVDEVLFDRVRFWRIVLL